MNPTLTSLPAPVRLAPRSFPAHRRTERVAVLLNTNAGSVTDSIHREIARFVPADDIYVSRDLADARAIVSRVLREGYTTLLIGGGDGTFVGVVNEVLSQLEDEEVTLYAEGGAARKAVTRRRTVKFGVLRLGTGNALAGLVGAATTNVGMIEDILRTRSGDVPETRRIQLIRAGDRLVPFAGLGTDAKVLADFIRVKNLFGHTPLGRLASGVAGYVASGLGLTVPSMVMEGQPANVEVINEGVPVEQLGPDGKVIGRPIATGEVIYRGPCRLAAAGTVPAYGFGFTIFPHALRRPGRMQLRLTAMSASEMVRHLPALWKGRTPCASILDFSAEKVRMRFDRKMPYQVGGDSQAPQDEVRFAVDPRSIELLDFKSHG
jgi:diacylglycerol kinase family enzyme